MLLGVIILIFAFDMLILSVAVLAHVLYEFQVNKRDKLDRLADHAVSLMGQINNGIGSEKMSDAIDWVDQKINRYFHVKVKPDEIRAAVQYAFDHSNLKHGSNSSSDLSSKKDGETK